MQDRFACRPASFLPLFCILSASFLLADSLADHSITCDSDSDCFFQPNLPEGESAPALLVLSCTGATERDLDSNRIIADSLGWVLASCHGSRNHRSGTDNDRDIMNTVTKLLRDYPVAVDRVYVCGFSGMGAQSVQELLAHPDVFRGIVASCTPFRDLPPSQGLAYAGHAAYLISRVKDWNLEGNRALNSAFASLNIATRLLITPGQHEPGGPQELLKGCRWVLDNTP